MLPAGSRVLSVACGPSPSGNQGVSPIIMIKIAIIAGVLALAACGNSTTSTGPLYEITGSRTERVARVTALVGKHKPPPTPIADAFFLEESIGDGNLGPSDFRSFGFIQVDPRDVSLWIKTLEPLREPAQYGAPGQYRDWWVAREDFASLRFFEPGPLTGRHQGWIGISPKTGRIYLFTFTT